MRSARCLGREVALRAPTDPAAVAVPAMRPARKPDGRGAQKERTGRANAGIKVKQCFLSKSSSLIREGK